MQPQITTQWPTRAWYADDIAAFLNAPADAIVGRLATGSAGFGFTVLPTQTDAWLAEVEILQRVLVDREGALFLEFNIPRMGKRVDAVLVIAHVIFVVEFKVGENAFERSATEQAWDYALDLANFHEGSHGVPIVPMLVATGARAKPLRCIEGPNRVYDPMHVAAAQFRAAIELALDQVQGDPISINAWKAAPYRPTPTIIEAARALYAQHSVEAIARSDAGAQNLHITSQRVEALIAEARKHRLKTICFVTGVPGAGKTLVGLDVATRHREPHGVSPAVFLSGNGPLVDVLREALTRDEFDRAKLLGEPRRKNEIRQSVKSFLQNVHHFRDDGLADSRAPAEHVAIFDEAQRAWNREKTLEFMRNKKKRSDFNQSEAEFLISYLDRHVDWAVVVCLVGGGQEIHRGEAGIDAWLEAVERAFPHWHVHLSSRLVDSEYGSASAKKIVGRRMRTRFDDALHLGVSMRSFRAEHVSTFVKALLDVDEAGARDAFAHISARYPIAICRDLDRAKAWIRKHARGSERYGLVASSKAMRLKPHAIDIRVKIDPVHWFLNDKDDTRSSYYLEDAATEFQVQGLELDWACVTWDGDLRHNGRDWTFHDFRGDRWQNVANLDNRRYLRNAYRVLLTRARQGMVIFVPPGDPNDPTRRPEYYDATFRYLTSIGIPVV